jgi:hypothetical protein
VTSAWVGEVTVTLVTLAVACEARLLPAWALMTDAKVDPCWSRLIRFATGVCGLKKASQFVVIALSAPVEEEPGDVADGAAAAGDDGVEVVVLVPLLHAARPPPMAETRRIQETNLRVFTHTFSSFPVSLAMSLLTPASAKQFGKPYPE